MRRLPGIGLLAGAIALGTSVGWWLVPVVGLLWGLTVPWPERRPVRGAALAAGLAWAGWLGYDALAGQGGLGRLGARLGPVLHAPFPVLLGATVGFAMLLAGAAAAIGCGLGLALAGRRSAEDAP